MVPGEIKPARKEITINEGRDTVTLKVANTGDRAIQVGSHYHFFEVNKALKSLREEDLYKESVAVENLFNVSSQAYIDVPCGCCVTIAVENTSDQAIEVQNANLIVVRVA